ncbi:emp24/gp25L/p24 family/GOLD-domain-containing protein [Halteromyces radiatus]|uniref:emp24/gp25L/p24 family/GOLD-domain-containing protein n=1 Tax=Halteromyces radiatus TaxID=101107 RepID=UPI00221EF97A|nr:emp24/gp25L/p24 family/GOLD-domain-containing protein [Halteromyces radiatus]KAI8082784.1 emp24/gp25L/p24 family/GOLD-domain-containing protein [Halteromyces radiatus]
MRTFSISFLIGVTLVALSSAVKFDLHAALLADRATAERCFSQYVPKDTKVLVTVSVGPGYNQRVDCNIFEDGEQPNIFAKKQDIKNDYTNAFDTLQDGEINICFSNILDDGFLPSPDYSREIDLEVNVGTEAKTIEEITKNKHLPNLEEQTQVLEAMVDDILKEMNYLKGREAKLRNTNESTNDRVKWFSLLSLFTLISLGIWQILYLRSFFRRKRLID